MSDHVKNHGMPNLGMRLAGEKVGMDRSGDRCIVVHNPFTNRPIASVPKATLAEVRQAFAIAKAFKSTLTRFERANILNKAAALVRERTAQVAALINDATCAVRSRTNNAVLFRMLERSKRLSLAL